MSITEEELKEFVRLHKKVNDTILEAFGFMKSKLTTTFNGNEMEFSIDYTNETIEFDYEDFGGCSCCDNDRNYVCISCCDIASFKQDLGCEARNARNLYDKELERQVLKKKLAVNSQRQEYLRLKEMFG